MAEPEEPYEEKFSEFIQTCAEAKGKGADHVIVPNPQVLGDTYAELVESLNRLADAGLLLNIAKSFRKPTGAPKDN